MVRISDILKKGSGEGEEPRKKKPEEAKKEETSPEVAAKEVKEERPPAAPVEVARAMKEETKVTSPDVERIYQDLLVLVKDILDKGTKDEPIEGKEIAKRIEKLVDQMQTVADGLVDMTSRSTPDNYLYGHTINVCLLSIAVGIELGYDKSKLNELGISSLLHDIGMVKVMDIIEKPQKLTREEYEKVQQHPVYGAEILKKAKNLSKIAIYVAHEQHEKVDGSGYPKGLKEDEINEYARIVGVVDAYEAMVHPRPQRKKLLTYEAIRELLKNKARFDTHFLKVLIGRIGVYPAGSWMMLNTNEIGRVVKSNNGFPLRPTVNVLFDPDGRKLAEVRSVDLTKYPTLYIKKPLEDGEWEAKLAGT